MAGSGMRFSRSRPPGARRSRPEYSVERPEHAETSRRAQRQARAVLSAGFHPPGTTGGHSTPTTRAPSVLGGSGWGLPPRTAGQQLPPAKCM